MEPSENTWIVSSVCVAFLSIIVCVYMHVLVHS
jgi:hypothetical protein